MTELNIGFIIEELTDNNDLENIQEKLNDVEDQIIEHEVQTTTNIEYRPIREYSGFKKNKQKKLRPFEQWIYDKYIGNNK